MAKSKTEETKKSYTLLTDYGTNKDGSPKKKMGSSIRLTEEEAKLFKRRKLI